MAAITRAPVHAVNGYLVSAGKSVAMRVRSEVLMQQGAQESAGSAAWDRLHTYLTSTRAHETVSDATLRAWAGRARKSPLLCPCCEQAIPDRARSIVIGRALMVPVDLGIVHDVLLLFDASVIRVSRLSRGLALSGGEWDVVIAARIPEPDAKVHELVVPKASEEPLMRANRFNPPFKTGSGWPKKPRVVDSPPPSVTRNRVYKAEETDE